MKHLLVLLGLTVGFVAPLSAQNTPGNSQEGGRLTRSDKPTSRVVIPGHVDSPVTYYVTSFPSTGSHIPVVVRRYRGGNTTLFHSSPGSGYSAGDIGLTGSLSVQGALISADPAISSGGAFRGGR